MSRPTQEQIERAIEAAVNRTEDPLKNWTRIRSEECPICMLPLPFKASETKYCVTCGKTVCVGCMISTAQVHKRDSGDVKAAVEKVFTCPYCRSDTRIIDNKYRLKQEMKRANAGNHEAMFHLGEGYFKGDKQLGLQQDKVEGLKWYDRAVKAGSGWAAYVHGGCYLQGDGVEKDQDKALEYFQRSADIGFIPSFALIGDILMKKGEIEEGMLNYRKAAMCGMNHGSLFDALRKGFSVGFITKDEYAFTLRENQKACNEMKSEGRERWKRHNPSC